MIINPLLLLRQLGQSVWLDYIQRDILTNGQVASMITLDGLVGITSNPSIFEKAIIAHDDYKAEIETLTRNVKSVSDIYEILTVADVRQAADVFRTVYDITNGRDGLVSLEVSPHLAYDTKQTIAEATRLWADLDRPNVMIKVPATPEGLPAITQLIAAGINVNVTLLFGLERYRQVVDAYMTGLEQRLANNESIAQSASVASFFVSRIDSLVDRQLDELAGTEAANTALALRGKTAITCARLAYQYYKEALQKPRWLSLLNHGAQSQRLLWASTSTKDPTYSEIKYIEALIGHDTVNTMPPQTLAAYRQHGRPAMRIEQQLDEAQALPAQLAALGIDLEKISQQLEAEGVQKFIDPFDKVLAYLGQRQSEIAF